MMNIASLRIVGLAACALGIASAAWAASSSASPVSWGRSVASGVTLTVIKVNLADRRVRITGVTTQPGHCEQFQRLVRRARPVAAVTGTYFNMSTLCPMGDILIDGKPRARGTMRTGFYVRYDNRCRFVKTLNRKSLQAAGARFALFAGPRLVSNGRIALNAKAEGFRDKHLLGTAPRLAVGLSHQRLLFVATRAPITLGKMAAAMRALGCTEAMNLDAGASLGMYDNGRVLASPGRRLTNLILVYEDGPDRLAGRRAVPTRLAGAR